MPYAVVKHPAGNPLTPFRAIEIATEKEVDVIRCTLGSPHFLIPPATGRVAVIASEIHVPVQGLRNTVAKNFLGTKIPFGISFLVFTSGLETFIEKIDGTDAFSLKYTRVSVADAEKAVAAGKVNG